MGSRSLAAIGLSLLLVYVPAAPADPAAAVGLIATSGRAEINGTAAPAETTLFSGDRIATWKETMSSLRLSGGDQIFLPSLTTAQVQGTGDQLEVTLERGAVAVRNLSGQRVVVQANGTRIQTAQPGGIYEVAINGTVLKVLARRGTALVKGSNRTVEVKEGRIMEATTSPGPFASGALGPLWTVVLVAGAAAGFVGLALGITATTRSQPQECTVVSPDRISCP